MKKTELFNVLNKIAPLDLQEEWDNCGVQIDLGKDEIDKVLLALEIDKDVVDFAAECGAEMIITHHPLIFPPNDMRALSVCNVNQKNIISLIKKGIEVYSAHTCYDAAPGCMNDYLCEILGIQRPQTISGNILRIGKLKEPVRLSDFEKTVKTALGDPQGVLCGGDPKALIRTIAVCSGGGGSFWEDAYKAGADLYVSGELGHHDMGYIGQTNMAFIAAGHAATEWIFVPRLASQLKRMCMDQIEVAEYPGHQIPFSRVL